MVIDTPLFVIGRQYSSPEYQLSFPTLHSLNSYEKDIHTTVVTKYFTKIVILFLWLANFLEILLMDTITKLLAAWKFNTLATIVLQLPSNMDKLMLFVASFPGHSSLRFEHGGGMPGRFCYVYYDVT